jgi:DNA modification methylase
VSVVIWQGDCLDVLRTLPAESVDACVTDPPYGLEFMSVAWDTFSDRAKGRPRTPNEWGDFGTREHPRKASEAAGVQRKKNLAFLRLYVALVT